MQRGAPLRAGGVRAAERVRRELYLHRRPLRAEAMYDGRRLWRLLRQLGLLGDDRLLRAGRALTPQPPASVLCRSRKLVLLEGSSSDGS